MSDVVAPGIPWPTLPDPPKVIVAGSSGTGKSTIVCSTIRESVYVYGYAWDEIRIFYEMLDPQFAQLAEEMPIVKLQYGMPDEYLEELRNEPPSEVLARRKLVVMDDLAVKISKKPDVVTNLFLMGSSHLRIGVILITQNFFMKALRDTTLNANFIILTKMNRGLDQVARIARNSADDEEEVKLAIQAYKAAMKVAVYAHFCINLSISVDRRLKYSTGLLPSQARLYFLADRDAQRPILET